MIYLSKPVLVAVSDEKTSELEWGKFQFPLITKTKDGKIALRIHYGQDLVIPDIQASELWFISEDGGKSFKKADKYEIVDTDEKCLTLPDGRKFFVGHGDASRNIAELEEMGILPVTEVYDNNDREGGYHRINCGYLVSDFPESFRNIPIKAVDVDGTVKESYNAVFHDSEIIIPACMGENTPSGWKNVKPFISYESYDKRMLAKSGYENCNILVLKDGTWLSASLQLKTVIGGKGYEMLKFYVSKNEGRDWELRSVINPNPMRNYTGFTEEAPMVILSDGTIMLAVRTEGGRNRYTDGFALYLSHDMGYTWEERPDISLTATHPVITMLGDEAVIVYGRPGVYVKTTKDGIYFSKSITLVGSPEEDMLPHSDKWWNDNLFTQSCANATSLKLDEENMLVAYSDFKYGKESEYHKAIYVVKIMKKE